MNEIADTAKIFKNVQFGENVTIEDYVIIGTPPMKKKEGELKTIIGENAVIRSHSVIYAGNIIGDNFQTGNNVNIREENSIGNNVSVGTKSVIEFKTKIEDNVRLHSQAFIPEYSELKKGCWIGPNVVLTNAKYPKSIKAKEFLEGVVIGTNAKIGANTTILPGVVIGDNTLVGAGSVVTKSIPCDMIIVGNPAKIIGNTRNVKHQNGEEAYSGEK